MKKSILGLLISLFVLGFSSMAFGQNMVSNPGFENWTAGEPDDWTLNDQSGDCSFSQEVGGGVTGDALKIIANSNGGGYDGEVSQIVTGIVEGTNYNFSIMVKDNTDVIKCRWWCYWKDDTGANIGGAFDGEYLINNSEDWQLFETAAVTAPTGATQVKYAVRVYFSGTPAEEFILLDDASLTIGTGGIPISKAYSLSSTAMDIFYNANLTTVNAEDYTLTGTTTITFSTATIDEIDQTLVHLTGASEDMIGDLTLDNIYDSANDTDYDFYAGITPIALTNTLNPGGHIENGKFATFAGMLTANDEYNNVWVSDDIGAYNGVLIYDYDFVDSVGTDLTAMLVFAAKRDEYNSLTELKAPILISLDYVDCVHPATLIDGADIDITIAENTNPAEQWEGQLIAIDNVLVAAPVRDYYIGSDDDWVTTFVIGDNVDYQYNNIGPILDAAIASGEPINVKGVVDWDVYEDYYRINPRDADDIVPSGATPVITKAYAINTEEVDVLYNLDMTSVNASDYTLTGTSTITFSDATIDETDSKLVHLTGASEDMIGDIILDNIYDSANDTDYDFYAGITPIALTNTLNPGGHIENDKLATFAGMLTANDEYNNVWVSDDIGAYNGVLIYDDDFVDSVGTNLNAFIVFAAKRDEYYSLTELKDPILISLDYVWCVHQATLIDGADIDTTIAENTNPAEQWEGQLVKIQDAYVEYYEDYYYICTDDEGATHFKVGDAVDYHFANITITVGETFHITGVVDFSYGKYRINPRFLDDIEPAGPGEFDVAGNIGYYSDASPIPDADVELTGDETYSTTTTTSGDYIFNDIPGGNYVSTPSKTDDLGGLSGVDASRIARYAADLYTLDCLEMIAADVSMNGFISGMDASRVARYVAGLITELNTSGINWVFTPEPIPNCDDWPPIVYENTREYAPLDSDLIDEDFIGIRLGDVSGNWSPDTRMPFTQISSEATEIEASINSTLRLPIVIEEVTAIEGIDIGIEFNPEVFHLTELTLNEGILEDRNYGVETNLEKSGQGKIVIYAKSELVSESGVVAFIDFDVIGKVGSTSEIYFTKFDLNETKASGGLQVIDSEEIEVFTRRLEVNVVEHLPDKFVLYPNYPNPFRNHTTISYALPEATNVKIQIYNIRGQLVAELVNGFEIAGNKKVVWNAEGYANGIYFCNITAGNHNNKIKLVLMK